MLSLIRKETQPLVRPLIRIWGSLTDPHDDIPDVDDDRYPTRVIMIAMTTTMILGFSSIDIDETH